MKPTAGRTVIADVVADDFIGREPEIARLLNHAEGFGSANGVAILSAPSSGASELLRQVFDRLFDQQKDIIPVYFAVKRSDATAAGVALRFAREFLTQAVAFHSAGPGILAASPDITDLAELAAPDDTRWIAQLVEGLAADKGRDPRSVLKSCISAPLKAADGGANLFVMLDDLHELPFIEGGDALLDDFAQTFKRADFPFVFSGRRRYLFGLTTFESMPIDRLSFADAGLLASRLASKFGIDLSPQTRDLMAVQLNGNPVFLPFLFAAAREKSLEFESFRSLEQAYAESIFGGRICKYYDAIFDRVLPTYETQAGFLRAASDSLQPGEQNASGDYWHKRLGLPEREFRSAMKLLNIAEIVSLGTNSVEITRDNTSLNDYLRGRIRLEINGEIRAMAIGREMSAYVKRAPQLMARLYRRLSALGLREVMQSFDGQSVSPALIDYGRFKAEFKGGNFDEALKNMPADDAKIVLPRIVYVANTAAFYRPAGEVIEAERSAIALGFGESDSDDNELVWLAAEIDSKLEASREAAEFWCGRLELVAENCGFGNIKIWLVAPEGFTPDAMAALAERGAFGSSRQQVEHLIKHLTPQKAETPKTNVQEYEIVVPMGEGTELVAVRAVEDIAKRQSFPPKAINQIKTALVEAYINAAEHSLSPDRKIYQKCSVDDEKLSITIANRGVRMKASAADAANSDEARRGWGLKLIKGLMDEVNFEQTDDGTRLTMVKYLKKR